jgi:hypothetical protein
MSLNELIEYIKSANINDKKDYMQIIKDTLDSFVDYFNIVVDMQIFSQTNMSWTSKTEYMYKVKDENRRESHNICISYCEKINQLAKLLDFDLYIDTTDRHIVACFIGNTIMENYSKGIDNIALANPYALA